jgi:hypothetical protein
MLRIAMKPEQPTNDETLSQAIALIDPSHTLVLGTELSDTIRYMILGWIEQFGPEYALQMAQSCEKHLERWQKFV